MVPKSMPTMGQLVFMERPEYVRTTKYIFYGNCSIPLYVSMQGTHVNSARSFLGSATENGLATTTYIQEYYVEIYICTHSSNAGGRQK